MIPVITQVLPVYPSHIRIQWSIEDRESCLGTIDVLRSQSQTGPFNVLETLDPNNYNYADFEANVLGLTRSYWYIIRANSRLAPSEYVLSAPVTTEYELKGHRAKVARKARRDLKLQLERLNGVPIIILKRKTFGDRCTNCYNSITNDVMYSHCNVCFGTTYVDGYYDPCYTYGKLDPVSLQESIGTSGPNHSAVIGLTIVEYPVVDINDLVIEVKTNRRFKVMRKIQSESSRVLVHQDLQISELSRAGIEYEIPVRLSK
jgi:hypothetical protein